MSSKEDVFRKSKLVKMERPAVSAITLKKQEKASGTSKQKDANAIVRFRNHEDREVGRMEQTAAAYACACSTTRTQQLII